MIKPAMGWLLASVCCSSVAHLSLKLAARALPSAGSLPQLLAGAIFNPWLCAGIALHVFALGLWVIGLRTVDLSVAYPFIALGLVLVSLLSWGVLDERLAAAQWFGIALITVGVVTVAAR
jgi:multidrug transporter EmrE-like cation transporter